MTATASRLLFCACLAAVGISSVSAQTVYRCGPNGNQYSQHPCDNGKALDVSDARSDEQVKQAQKAIRDDHKLGLRMAKERREEERARPLVVAGNIGPAGRKAEDSGLAAKSKRAKSRAKTGSSKAQREESQEFSAIEPGSHKKKPAKKLQD